MESYDLDKIRIDTMKALGISDPAKVDYITKELIDGYLANSKDAKSPKRQSVDENGKEI